MEKKDLVNLIQKYAQIPQLTKQKAAPGSVNISNPTPTTSENNSGVGNLWDTKNHPSNHVSYNGSSGNISSRNIPEVKNLQSAIHDLANTVMQNSLSVKSLNDFISEQYISSLDPDKKGIELQSAPQKNKQQTDTYEIDVVMNNLQKISQDSDVKITGIWDVKTDNALRNILGLSYALLQLEGDFKLRNQNYSSKNWNDFNKLLSGYSIKNNVVSLSSKEQTTRAEILITHIKNIRAIYNSFKYQMQSKPEYISLIEGKKSFDQYDQTQPLSESDNALLENPYSSISVQDKDPNSNNQMTFIIPLSALESKDSFINYMKKFNVEDEKIIVQYLQSFTKKINELRG